MRSILWQRLFGNTGTFAIRLGLTEEPFSSRAQSLRSASWGTLEIWVRGRCITAAHHDRIGDTTCIEWYLLELLRWGISCWGPLFHEAGFPSVLDRVADAAAWSAMSLNPPLTLLESEERRWFQNRLSWWGRHALRAAADGGCFPNVLIRRVQNEVEVSWDNDTFPPCHPEVTFNSSRGRDLLPVREVAVPFAEGLRALAVAIRERHNTEETRELVDAAAAIGLTLREAGDLFLPTVADNLLRGCAMADRRPWHEFDARMLLFSTSGPNISRADIDAVLDVVGKSGGVDWRPPVAPRRLVPSVTEPYHDGYELALELRDALGWGADPCGDLFHELGSWGVVIERVRLASSAIHGFAVHTPGCAPIIGMNQTSPRAGRTWSENMLLAHELCHLLFDIGSDGVTGVLSGMWAEWPMEARANAFAAMLLMPDDGVRSFIAGRPVTSDIMREFLGWFGVGALAGTWHLRNRGFITEGQRLSLLLELGARRELDFGTAGFDLPDTGY